MGIVQYLQVVLFVFNLTLSTEAQKKVTCQNFKFAIDDDVIHNQILEGHVFERLTVPNAIQCHLKCKDDCLCVSMNYFPLSKENNCELNEANKDMEPAAMKWRQGGNYYDLVRSYTVKGGDKYTPEKHHCNNRCCRTNPCLNGGVCQEICDTHSTRFNCSCPNTYSGHLRSCKDIAKNGASTSGKYDISNSENERFSVYCDLQSEPGFVWTLTQSFSFSKRKTFNYAGFGKNLEIDIEEGEANWNEFRLSLSQMQYLANHSTHLRATCNFSTDGLQYTDYARAKLAGHDIFGTWDTCKMYEYVNIRGIYCSNCTALTKQQENVSWHIRSYASINVGCKFDGKQGGVPGEKNFGKFEKSLNPDHRCSFSPASTTQHWFGAKCDE
ncbi:unnamed protein product [Pocillopora meandrina]|uniref:Apple domain-containing protein n=1 Tax=Pocillopora meandrina TaxID=46732 RepID=A0AAU9W4R7_9CNID|nr:unnamed protein product [Pocillopora meandrina]